MIHPEVEDGESDTGSFGRILPVYPSTEGISQRVLRKIIEQAVAEGLTGEKEFLPATLRARNRLPGRSESIRGLHAPPRNMDPASLLSRSLPWRRRLAFDELLLLQIGIAARALRERRGRRAAPREFRGGDVQALRAALPFSLTSGQEKVYGEIAADLSSTVPMNRLLQGDVGSGKTLIAAMAALLAAESGEQTALMVPTEILAEQHFATLQELLGPVGAKVCLLTGSLGAGERKAVLEGLRRGDFTLAVGTQSLIQEAVRFRRLGLAVIDEQHRFGVRQRLRLRDKGWRPDLLVMTATPIPRTLALTLYGDMDVSVIDTLPPGRKKVKTFLAEEKDRGAVYEKVRIELGRGGRVFVIAPLVEGGAEGDDGAAVELAGRLGREVLREFSVGLLHGRMGIEERNGVMKRFRSGDLDVLVATTVVEVGVDVPEATVMVVEKAESFGLSQLHQLRGRIGRGGEQAWCFLVVSPGAGEEARLRLKAAASTHDGFRLAEEDLRLRGPGEFFGTRQSGLPRLKAALLPDDSDLLLQAREAAAGILAQDPHLAAPKHALLRERARAFWREKYLLGNTVQTMV